MTAETVPFGKYKGQPVADMLADADYMAWLEAQPWFRERFKHLAARRDADAMSRTPVHNRLQALFLDRRYALAFVCVAQANAVSEVTQRFRTDAVCGPGALRTAAADLREAAAKMSGRPDDGWERDRAAEHEKKAEKLLCQADQIAEAPVAFDVNSRFEHHGADVFVSVRVSGLTVERHFSSHYNYSTQRYEDIPGAVLGIAKSAVVIECPVEIKPTVADEYPAILRQMNRNGSGFLFVGEYSGEGATEAQFVALFAASGKKVVFKRDVDAMAEKLPADASTVP